MIAERVDELLVWADLILIGRIAKAQGRAGEVVVNHVTESPDRFAELSRIYVESPSGEPLPFIVEGVRFHKDRPVLKLEGVSSIGEAEALSDKEVRIPEKELLPLPDGSFYHFEIVGLSVVDVDRGALGVVESVVATGGTDVLVVRSPDGAEHLVPLCADICRRIDPSIGRIEIEAPEGLVGLNAC